MPEKGPDKTTGEAESPQTYGKPLLDRGELVRQALDGKLQAIAGYDSILWKIRSGYLAILYASLALILGTARIPDLRALALDLPRSVAAVSLISGFSLAAFLVDFGYLRKKLKVIVARDALVHLALDGDADSTEKIRFLLRISGEAGLPDGRLFSDALAEYNRQRNWNLAWITLWLYGTTPIVALIIYWVARCSTAS
jgi:hypothetical protein